MTTADAVEARAVLLPIEPGELAALSADDVTARLERFSALYEQAMRPATVRAVRSDWNRYATWCRSTGHSPLGTTRDAIALFLRNAVDRGLRRSTLDRYLFTIRLAHRAAGIVDPTDHPEWKLFWKGIVSALAKDGRNRKRPAAPLRADAISRIVTELGDRLRDLRDAALLCLASDTLARREELARVQVEEIIEPEGGMAVLDIPSSKTDGEGHGKLRPISAETLAHLRRWMRVAGIVKGPVFRAVTVKRVRRGKTLERIETVGKRALHPQEVARIFRRRLLEIGIDASRISGHSTRIGSTHDLVLAGYTSAQIARSGGWANEDMVIYYSRELLAADSAMADSRRRNPLPAPPMTTA